MGYGVFGETDGSCRGESSVTGLMFGPVSVLVGQRFWVNNEISFGRWHVTPRANVLDNISVPLKSTQL